MTDQERIYGLMDLPIEVRHNVYRHMARTDAMRLCCASKQVMREFIAFAKLELSQAVSVVCRELLAGRAEGKVSIDIKEMYMGGAQPWDGNFVGVSPNIFWWDITNDQLQQGDAERWAQLCTGLRGLEYPFMRRSVFTHATLSWEAYEYEFDEMYDYPKVIYPEDVAAKIDTLLDKMYSAISGACVAIGNVPQQL